MEIQTERVTLYQAISALIQSREIDLHVAMPAQVTAYHADSQTVDCIPQLNRSLPDGAGNWVTEQLPKLSKVPVAFQRCSNFSITFPLAAGDFVFLVFSERNIAAWRNLGAQGDPGDLGMHTLDGAVAIPAIFPDKLALTESRASTSNLTMGHNTTGDAQIEITPTEIHLGAGASHYVALANLVKDQLDAIATKYNSHTHSYNAGTAGPALTTGLTPSYSAGDVASSNAKAK